MKVLISILAVICMVHCCAAKEDISKTAIEAASPRGFDIEGFINGVTHEVKKGKITDGSNRATVLENENAMNHKRYDTSVDQEEVEKRVQEESKKVAQEDQEKTANEVMQKNSEAEVKKRMLEKKLAYKEQQQQIYDEQVKKKSDEAAAKKSETAAKQQEEGRNKQIVQQAVERTKQETIQAQQEMKKKEEEEEASKKALEQASKKEVEEAKSKADAARQRAAQEVKDKKNQEEAQKAQVKREGEQKAAEAQRQAEQATKTKLNALGRWCGCMGHRVFFEQSNVWQSCPDGYLMAGLYRADPHTLSSVQYYHCCRPCQEDSRTIKNVVECSEGDWSRSFDSAGWSRCPDNTFMQGMYKSSCEFIYCIEYVKCCKVQLSRGAVGCEGKNAWGLSFDGRGWSLVDENKFMNGLYRSGDHWLYNIEYPFQCNFYANPPV